MGVFEDIKAQAAALISESMGKTGTGDCTTDPKDHAVLSELISMVQSKGLGGIVESFREKGLGDVANSWIGKGANLPISVDQLRSALGPQQIEEFARKLGLPADQISSKLAQFFPGLVDKLTPSGAIEESPAESASA